MSKAVSIIYFCIGFIETYLIMSFYIPSLQIALIAAPLDFFLANITSTWIFKTIIAVIFGILTTGLHLLLVRKKKNIKKITILLVLLLIITLIGVITRSFS